MDICYYGGFTDSKTMEIIVKLEIGKLLAKKKWSERERDGYEKKQHKIHLHCTFSQNWNKPIDQNHL